MYFSTRKVPINGRVRFKCLRDKCGECCKDLFINEYMKFWAKNNKVPFKPCNGHCVFLDEKKYRCTINEIKPKMCKLFPIVSVHKDYVKIANECPGLGRGPYISIKEWLKNSRSDKIEPDPNKTFVIYNPISTLVALVSLILSFSELKYSKFFLFYPVLWLYIYFRKNSLSEN